jgi:RNA 2',3'-cyclic 3'-phosphodiesterase
VSDDRARLFAALELPAGVRDALVSWRGALDLAALRHVAPESLHVTLCFLGSIVVSEIEAIAAAVAGARVAAPALLPLSLAPPIWLPRRRPNVLAVGVADPSGALAAVQSALSDALGEGGWYERESRPFLAHVTVARVRRGESVSPVELAPPPQLEFDGRVVTLFRSRTDPQGARYEALRRVEL